MKILNIPTPMLETYDSNNPKIVRNPNDIWTSGMVAINKVLPELNVWYCMITTESSLLIYDIKELMGDDFYQQLLEKKICLVIDLSFEAFYRCIDVIYREVIIKHKIPSSQVYFVSNMYDADQYNVYAAQQYNQEPIHIIWFVSLEFTIKNYQGIIPNTLEIKEYPKKFLNLNRRWRPHRTLLTTLLYHEDLIKEGYVSFGPNDWPNGWDRIWSGLKFRALDNREMRNMILKSEGVKNMSPLYLDTDDLKTNRANLTDSTNQFYENTYFSVVSETTFYLSDRYQSSRFITEKTFKALALKHPFILVTLPNSLDVLKELGYKTFSPWIDESYDKELNDNKRMMMILKEIKRLSYLQSTELTEFLIAMKDICEHNHNVLFNKKNFTYLK